MGSVSDGLLIQKGSSVGVDSAQQDRVGCIDAEVYHTLPNRLRDLGPDRSDASFLPGLAVEEVHEHYKRVIGL